MNDAILQIVTAIVGGITGTAIGYMGALMVLGKKLEKAVADFHNYVENKKEQDGLQDKKIMETEESIKGLNRKLDFHIKENGEALNKIEKEILKVMQEQLIMITELKKDFEYMRNKTDKG